MTAVMGREWRNLASQSDSAGMEVEREEKVVRNVHRKANGDDEEMFDDVISDCQSEENFLLASFRL